MASNLGGLLVTTYSSQIYDTPTDRTSGIKHGNEPLRLAWHRTFSSALYSVICLSINLLVGADLSLRTEGFTLGLRHPALIAAKLTSFASPIERNGGVRTWMMIFDTYERSRLA
ncbi:hypothetical protein U2366_15755 [Achromobacter xylosoxidans]|nr:hypothetical protein [Achromobacter xylosoxidans]